MAFLAKKFSNHRNFNIFFNSKVDLVGALPRWVVQNNKFLVLFSIIWKNMKKRKFFHETNFWFRKF